MKLILLLAWRHLVFRPGKTLLSALGIGLGIATVVAVLTVDHNTLLSQHARRSFTDPESDLLIQPLERNPAAYPRQAAALRSHDFLKGVTAFATGKWTVRSQVTEDGPAGKETTFRGSGVDVMAVESSAVDHHAAYVVDEGADLDFGSDEPQLLLSRWVAEQIGVTVGDLVELVRPPARQRVVTRCVDGKMVKIVPGAAGRRQGGGPPTTDDDRALLFRVVGLLAPTNLGFARHRVLTTMSQGVKLFGDDLSVHFWADFDMAAIDFLGVEAALRNSFTIKEPKRALAGQAPEEAAFRSGVRLCGFLALFLGLYVIFNTMSMSLVERVRQIGLLRALGVTRGRLAGIFLVEGGVLALLGAGLSVLLAERIVAVMVAARITTLGFGKPLEIHEVPYGPVVGVMVAGVVFSLLGVVYPFLRASKLSVIDALRRGVIEMSRQPFKGTRRSVLLGLLALVPVAWFVGAPGGHVVAQPLWEAFLQATGIVAGVMALLLVFQGMLPSAVKALLSVFRGPTITLAKSTVSGARHRVFATISGLMLVFAAVFLVVSVLESLKSETRGFSAAALDDRLFVKLNPEAAALSATLRGSVPETRSLLPINTEVFTAFLVRSVDARMLGVGSLAGDKDLTRAYRERPTLILSTRCADDFGYVTDDRVTLVTDADGPVEFRVLAVTDEYGFAPDDRIFAAVSPENMRRYWCRESNNQPGWYVAWAPGLADDDLEELAARIEGVVGAGRLLDLRLGREIGSEYLAQHDRDFAIFYAILVLTVMLAAIGVLNAMFIAVMERRREIGLLRAVGLTGGQVARMLLVESGAFGVVGGVLGLVLGIPLAIIAARALTALSHLDLVFVLSPRALGSVLAGAILVAVVAVLLPALRANHMKLSRIMRYE